MKKNSNAAQSRRSHNQRKNVAQVDVLNVKNISTGEVYFSRASIVDVSPTGLLLRIQRGHILTVPLRSTLTWATLVNISVGFTIEVMDTYIEGIITRSKPEGKGEFLLAVDFREDAPEYWRNCLVDLLPDHEN